VDAGAALIRYFVSYLGYLPPSSLS